MTTKINVPQPKYGFGQKVIVVANRNEVQYKPCSDCDNGQITMKSGNTTTCPTCHGSGKSYDVQGKRKWREIVGELTIQQVHIEMVDPTTKRAIFYGDNESPIAYQGHMTWFDKQENWNVFKESTCFATTEEAEATLDQEERE